MEPIFIGGCPRSGTTLLADLVAGSHKDVFSLPESPFLYDVLDIPRRSDLEPSAPAIRSCITEDPKWRTWEIEPSWSRVGEALESDGVAAALDCLVGVYAREHGYGSASAWVDHTPRSLHKAPRLLDIYPEATFVHLVRDGRAVAASVLPLDWGPNTGLQAAEWWTQHVGVCLAAEQSLPQDRFIQVRYEDLVRDPAPVLGTIYGAAGLPNPRPRVEPGGLSLPRYTEKQHEHVGSAPNVDRIDRWERVLSEAELRQFEHRARDLLELLGYEPATQPIGGRLPFTERLGLRFSEMAQSQWNKLRKWRREQLL